MFCPLLHQGKSGKKNISLAFSTFFCEKKVAKKAALYSSLTYQQKAKK
jgi:hypothetical protein